VKNVDINTTLERFTRNFQLSSEGVDIFNLDLHDFEYPDGETALTASRFLYNDENPTLIRNEEGEVLYTSRLSPYCRLSKSH